MPFVGTDPGVTEILRLTAIKCKELQPEGQQQESQAIQDCRGLEQELEQILEEESAASDMQESKHVRQSLTFTPIFAGSSSCGVATTARQLIPSSVMGPSVYVDPRGMASSSSPDQTIC